MPEESPYSVDFLMDACLFYDYHHDVGSGSKDVSA